MPTSDKIDMSKYKLRTGDFAHALLSLVVFSVLSLLDANSVRCLYPGFKDTDKILLQVLPPVIGIVAGGVFMLFPNDRYGIGYPFSSCDHDDDNSNATTSSTSTTTNNNDDKDKKKLQIIPLMVLLLIIITPSVLMFRKYSYLVL